MANLTVGDITPRAQYTASANQTTFAYGFPIFLTSDLKVYIGSTLKTLSTHYSVTGAATTAGGNVVLGTGVASGTIITIVRDVPVSRASDYQTGGTFRAETLNDDLDKIVMMAQQLEDQVKNNTLTVDQFDDTSINLTLPVKDTRKGTVLGFNASTGAPEAGPTIANVSSLATITDKITTVAGIAANVTSVANDATDIGAVAAKATEIGRLGTSAAVADLAILGTSAIVADLAILGTNDVVADMAILATNDVVADMNLLATSDIVTDMNLLATSANVTAMGHLGTSANVTAQGLLGNSATVADLAILGTAAIVEDLSILGTSDVVTDMNILATSDNVTNMNTLADNISNANTVAFPFNILEYFFTNSAALGMYVLGFLPSTIRDDKNPRVFFLNFSLLSKVCINNNVAVLFAQSFIRYIFKKLRGFLRKIIIILKIFSTVNFPEIYGR